MKISTLFAILGATVAAGNTQNVETLAVKDQMKSLSNLVGVAQTRKANNMISAIADRKAELEYQMALAGNSADKRAIARELQFLLDLVGNVESNDFAAATKTLAHRKNKLMKYSMHAKTRSLTHLEGEESKTTEETKTTEESKTTEETKTVAEIAAENKTTQDKAVEDAQKAYDDAKKAVEDAGDDATDEQKKAQEDAKKALDEAKELQKKLNDAIADLEEKKTALDEANKVVEDAGEDATDQEKTAAADAQTAYDESEKALKDINASFSADGDADAGSKSKTGAIIGGVVVAGLLVGGCVYYKKKQNDNEGGEKEDKTLFKKQFKGNTMKKVQKEALVPSFAVPAEENI